MELVESNQKLSDQLVNLQNQFEVVAEELTLIEKQRDEKTALKKVRAGRKRFPKR